MLLPVIRIVPGTYAIGLLKYKLEINFEGDELVGASSGMTLADMLKKVHWKQIEQIEQVTQDTEKDWTHQVKEALVKHGAS